MKKVLNGLEIKEIKNNIEFVRSNNDHNDLVDLMKEYIAEHMHDMIHYNILIAIQDGIIKKEIRFDRSEPISMCASRIVFYNKAHFVNFNTYWQLWNKAIDEYIAELNTAYNEFGYNIEMDYLSTYDYIDGWSVVASFPDVLSLKIKIVKEEE